MSYFWKVVLGGTITVVVYSCVASYSMQIKPEYIYSPGKSNASLIIYCVCGFLVSRRTTFWSGVTAATAVGFVDSTIGWLLSLLITPREFPDGGLTLAIAFTEIKYIVFVAFILGAIGSGVAFLVRKKPNKEN